MSNDFFKESRKKIQPSFVLPLVTLSRPLSPSERKRPSGTFVLHWRDIVAESQVARFSGERGGGGDWTCRALSVYGNFRANNCVMHCVALVNCKVESGIEFIVFPRKVLRRFRFPARIVFRKSNPRPRKLHCFKEQFTQGALPLPVFVWCCHGVVVGDSPRPAP